MLELLGSFLQQLILVGAPAGEFFENTLVVRFQLVEAGGGLLNEPLRPSDLPQPAGGLRGTRRAPSRQPTPPLCHRR